MSSHTRKSNQALLVVICSPWGGGKTTVIQKILRKNPSFRRSISVTTRVRRPQETSGRDYYFVSTAKFREMIKEKALVEWAEVYGNWYGTPKSLIQKAHKYGW